MQPPLDELYFVWLYEQVGGAGRVRSRTHWELIRQLYQKEFVWKILNDENREADGRDLRHEFCGKHRVERVDKEWFDMGCSVLEMLIALSRRLSFEAEGEPREWFWHLMQNLGFDTFSDAVYNQHYAEEVDEKLDKLIWRHYKSNGKGGLFPLEHPEEDQRKVEIWYQLNAYLLESG